MIARNSVLCRVGEQLDGRRPVGQIAFAFGRQEHGWAMFSTMCSAVWPVDVTDVGCSLKTRSERDRPLILIDDRKTMLCVPMPDGLATPG